MAEKKNGAQLHRICRRQQVTPMATWQKRNIARQDKWKQQQESETRENWETENQERIRQHGPARMGIYKKPDRLHND